MNREVKNLWKGKRVLVTGAAGFIGSHMCDRLVKEASEVRAFVRYNSSNSFGLLEVLERNVQNNIEIIPGDLMDESSIAKATRDVDIIFHFAALPGIPYSFQNPRHVFLVNTVGTFNLLTAARSSGVSRVILVSSAGASDNRPLLSPYIMSKSAMERVGLGFHQGLDLSVSTVRLMNNYGPGQSARAIIPTIISQALVRNDVHLGALEPRMDFNFIDDTIEALVKTAEIKNTEGKILTWGTGKSTSIKELAELIFSITGNKELHIVTDPERVRPYPGPMASLDEDIMETQALLDYSPGNNLEEGLQKTMEWISLHPERYKTEVYNI